MERKAHLRDDIRPLRSSYMDCKLLLILFPVGCDTWKEQSGLPLRYCQSGELQHPRTLTKKERNNGNSLANKNVQEDEKILY